MQAATPASVDETAVVLDDLEREHALAGAGMLAAGILLLVCFFLFVRKSDKRGLCDFPYGVEDVAATYELSYSPRSRPWPYRCAANEQDPAGRSCVYWFAWLVVLVWLAMTAVWFLVIYFDVELAMYREERFSRASAYVAAALVLCALWIPMIQFGSDGCGDRKHGFAPQYGCRAPNFYAATVLVLVAYAFSVAAEVEFDAWSYPGPGMWIFVGVGFSLLSGWLSYASWLTLGIALSASVRTETARDWYDAGGFNRYGSAKLFLATLCVTTPICLAVPSPGHAVWLLLVVGGYTPRFRWNVATVVLAALLLLGSVLRVVAIRNDVDG